MTNNILKLTTTLAFLVFSATAFGQSAAPFQSSWQQFFDNNGVPLQGGKLCTYQAGTTSPQATFTDSTGSTPNTNPVILDAAGRAQLWMGGLSYHLYLYPASGACLSGPPIWTQDNVTVLIPPNTGFFSQGTGSSIFNNNGGSVGIGTGTPLAPLNVSGASSGNNMVLRLDDSANKPGITLAGSGSIFGVIQATSNTNLNVLTSGGFSQFYVAPSQVGVWDQTPSTGVTGFLIRAGANQTGNDLATWVNNGGTIEGGISTLGEAFATDGSGHTQAQFKQGTGMAVNATGFYVFSQDSQAFDTPDTGLCRVSAGTVGIMNGVACTSLGNLQVQNITINGTCTGSGCGGGGGGGSPGGISTSIQINNGLSGFGGDASLTYTTGASVSLGNASFLTVGVAAGFDATNCVAYNCFQAPVGGGFANLYSFLETAGPIASGATGSGGGAGAGGANIYADSTAHMLKWSENNGSFYTLGVYSGSITTGHCASFNISAGVTAIVDAGGACTTGGGGGTVSSSSAGQVAVYSAATTVAGSAGLTFNTATGVETISGGSGPGLAMASVSLSATGILQLTGATSGVDVTTEANYNAVQVPNGGFYGLSFTALNYVQTGNNGSGTATPTPSAGDTYHYGAQYFNVGLGAQQLCAAAMCTIGTPGTGWTSLGTGSGSGTVSSSSVNNLAFYTASTTVGGSSGNFLTWTPGSQLLTVTGTSTSALAVNVTGYAQTTGGFDSTAVGFNSVQSTGGAAFCTGGGCTGGPALSVGSGAPFQVSSAGATTAHGLTISTITGSTQCLTVNSSGLVSGTGSACGSGATGPSGIQGTANEVLANGTSGSPVTSGTVILTTPQAIATTSSPTFAAVTANGAFNSTVAASSAIAFQTSSSTFSVDGYGDISSAGSINALGNSTLSLAPYRVNGTAVIDSSRNLLNIGTITASGQIQTSGNIVATGSGAINANSGYATGSFIGQSYSPVFTAGFTGIAGCSTGLVFMRGILVSCF